MAPRANWKGYRKLMSSHGRAPAKRKTLKRAV